MYVIGKNNFSVVSKGCNYSVIIIGCIERNFGRHRKIPFNVRINFADFVCAYCNFGLHDSKK